MHEHQLVRKYRNHIYCKDIIIVLGLEVNECQYCVCGH